MTKTMKASEVMSQVDDNTAMQDITVDMFCQIFEIELMHYPITIKITDDDVTIEC